MEFTKLHSQSLKELFIENIETAILSGELPVGSKLPTERELCNKMGVSRSVINSGFNEMAKKGFLEIFPRKGVFVADYRRNGTSDTLISIMNYNRGTLPNQDIKSLFEFKILIDTFSVKHAINNIEDKNIDTLWSYIEEIENCKSNKECALASYNFNQELAVLSGNTFAPLIYNSFKDCVIMLWEKYIELYGNKTIYDYSVNLLKLILNKEESKAVDYVEHHLNESINGSKQIYN